MTKRENGYEDESRTNGTQRCSNEPPEERKIQQSSEADYEEISTLLEVVTQKKRTLENINEKILEQTSDEDVAVEIQESDEYMFNTPYRYSRLTRPLELLTSTTITFPLWRQTFCFMTSKFYGNLCDFQQWRTNSDKVYR